MVVIHNFRVASLSPLMLLIEGTGLSLADNHQPQTPFWPMKRQHAPVDSSGNVVARLPKIPPKSTEPRGLCDFSTAAASIVIVIWPSTKHSYTFKQIY